VTGTNYICDRCKEPLCFIAFGDNVMIRPCRFGRCKNYKGAAATTCCGIGDNAEGAIMAFEHLTAVIPPASG